MNPRYSDPPPYSRGVKILDGKTQQLDVTLVPWNPPPDTGPCCKPYGAPPARRRVV